MSAVNVLLHLANCLLVWILMARLNVAGAWAVAAVFAVHPLHVDSVAWIIERKDLLSPLFYISFVADRYQYLAGLGVLAVLVAASAHAAGRLEGWPRKAAHAGGAMILAVLAAKTWSQAEVYRDGTTFFQHIVSLNPNARDAHLNLADAMVAVGRFDDSVRTARIAIEQRPDHASAHHTLGLGLAGLKRFEEAEDAFAKARELAPRDASIAHNQGQMYREAGRHEDAVEEFREALEIQPDLAVAHGAMGVALSVPGRHEEALEATAEAMSQWPHLRQMAVLQNAAGHAAWKLNDLGKAARHFQVGLESEPNDAGTHLNLGRVRLEQRRFDEGLEHLRQALDLRPGDSATMLEVGDALRRSGYAEQSLPFYRQVLEKSPANAGARAGTGLALIGLERYPESVEALEEAIALDPELPIAGELHRHLGTAHVELGNFEEAAETFTRAIESDPDDTDSMDRLGLLFFERGRCRDALGQYLALAELQPDSAQVQVNIGASLVQPGRDEETIPVFERAQAPEPDYEGLQSTLDILRRAVGAE